MWYECQWDNSPSKSQSVKVYHYRSKYGLQHGALAQNEQQAIKGPKIYYSTFSYSATVYWDNKMYSYFPVL